MRKKHRRTGSVILGIFIAAVIAVIVVVIVIYQTGVSYIKSGAGIKFFGYTDKDNNILSGRLWFEGGAADINLQKFYIAEAQNSQYASSLPDAGLFLADLAGGDFIDVPGFINENLPGNITASYPLNNFIFNKSDSGISLKSETFGDLLKNYQDAGVVLNSGEIYTSDGVKWVLVTSRDYISSYEVFEVVQDGNASKKYKGSVIDFVKNENINFASFVLYDGTVVNLYPARNIYRIAYDKGDLSGDLYIGRINGDFQKDGLGLYYSENGEISYGDFTKNEKTGNVSLLSNNGDSYFGSMENGRKTGEGYAVWSDGSSYTGELMDNMKHGRGRNVFADGSVYEGDFVGDVKDGYGKYIWAGGDVYEGDFANDLYNGKGRYTWANGDYYEGDFLHNTLHGYGTYYWTSGRSYEGWWDMGKMYIPENPGNPGLPDDNDEDGEED